MNTKAKKESTTPAAPEADSARRGQEDDVISGQAARNAAADDFVGIDINKLQNLAGALHEAITGVIEGCYVGNVLAVYDNGVDFDGGEVARDAADFVLKGLLGALCYNVIDGRKNNGAKMLNKASDDRREAAQKDAAFRSEKSAAFLHNKIIWEAKMDVQQSYRQALEPFTLALYYAVTQERYYRNIPISSSGAPNSPEQAVASSIDAKRANLEAQQD